MRKVRAGADLAAEADSLLSELRKTQTAALSYLHAGDTLFAWFVAPDGKVEHNVITASRWRTDSAQSGKRHSVARAHSSRHDMQEYVTRSRIGELTGQPVPRIVTA